MRTPARPRVRTHARMRARIWTRMRAQTCIRARMRTRAWTHAPIAREGSCDLIATAAHRHVAAGCTDRYVCAQTQMVGCALCVMATSVRRAGWGFLVKKKCGRAHSSPCVCACVWSRLRVGQCLSPSDAQPCGELCEWSSAGRAAHEGRLDRRQHWHMRACVPACAPVGGFAARTSQNARPFA